MLALADVGAGAVVRLLVAGSAARAMWALALLGWVLIAKLFGLYDRDQRSIQHLTVDERGDRCLVAAGTAMLASAAAHPRRSVSFVSAAGAWLMGTVVAGVLGGDALALAAHHSAGIDGRAASPGPGPRDASSSCSPTCTSAWSPIAASPRQGPATIWLIPCESSSPDSIG
jgi:hypothetical protein